MGERLRVLILEDNPADFELIKRQLRRAGFDFTVSWAQDQSTFIQALDQSSPDLILLDYVVPGFDGMSALALARQRFADTPILIVSGAIGEETAIETLKAGATDYVLKTRLSRLGPVAHRSLKEAKETASKRHAGEAGPQLRILILEDNGSDVELMLRELRKAGFNFTVRWAPDRAAFVQALDELTPDIILADYALPGFDGIAAIAMARQRFKDIPTIIVSGAIGEETAIEALKAGATDYVLKTRLSRLGPVAHRAVREAKEIGQRRQAQKALRETSRRLTTIIENSPLAMIEWDADFRIARWTNEAELILRWTAGEMLGKHLEEIRLFHEDDWPKVQEFIADIRGDRCARNVTTSRTFRRDGSIIWCEWYNSVLCDEFGKFQGLISLALDVTEKMRTDEILRSHVNLLQQAMLPTKPRIGPGYEVASFYVPAHVEEEVGGDFYDIFETESGRIGIVIGDVSGKGIQAASLAAITRSTVRAFEFEMFSTAEALTHANKVLSSYSATAGTFVTVHLTMLDPASGEIRYSSAGHPPPAIYRADRGEVEWLNHTDLPVRVMQNYEFREEEARLWPGDKMLFYTDGLSEAKTGSRLFGFDGIERTLHRHSRLPTKGIVEKLVQAAGDWAGGRLRDDTAILIIEREKVA